MANATKNAPSPKDPVTEAKEKRRELEHEYINKQFDPEKTYVFQLAEENMERDLPVIDVREKRAVPHRKFKPWHNIVLSSQIVWGEQRRNIRYYDGCSSIFVEDQPKDKDVIDQFIKQTKKRIFTNGKFKCNGDERMLLIYLNICSWNVDSPFRTKTANGIFKPTNADKIATEESKRFDAIEEALKLAREAKPIKMRIHANYLGVPELDEDSGNELSEKEIRTLYREKAVANPTKFIESYGNRSLEVKYYINKALEQGVIKISQNGNRAIWKESGKEICDISGLKSHEAIASKLFEFSQLEEGEEFRIQLTALYS